MDSEGAFLDSEGAFFDSEGALLHSLPKDGGHGPSGLPVPTSLVARTLRIKLQATNDLQ